MEQEEKELLLKDLCARLPYGVMVQDDMGRTYKLNLGNAYLADLCYGDGGYIETPIKPYLRPLSSMTEEEWRECVNLGIGDEFEDSYGEHRHLLPSHRLYDWLNKKMFDYRGLIEKDAAITVTKDNNPYK